MRKQVRASLLLAATLFMLAIPVYAVNDAVVQGSDDSNISLDKTAAESDIAGIYNVQLIVSGTADANAKVIDTVSEEFEIVWRSLNASQGIATQADNGIAWDIGNVGNNSAEMNYQIKVKPGYYGKLYTNDEANLVCVYPNGEKVCESFPCPYIYISPVPAMTPTPTPTPLPTRPLPTPRPTLTPVPSPKPTVTQTPAPTPSPSPTPTTGPVPSITPGPSVTPGVTPTVTPNPSITPAPTSGPEPTSGPAPTSTPSTPTSTPSTPTSDNSSTTYYTLTVNVTGQGTVQPETGTHNYASGTRVTLQAVAAAGWTFDRWRGDPIENGQILMNGNKAVTAVFIQTAEVSQEAVPGNPVKEVKVTPTMEPEEENTGEDNAPIGDKKLPKTGGVPVDLLFGAGGILTVAGIMIRKRS